LGNLRNGWDQRRFARLKKDWLVEDVIPAPKVPQRLPVVLSPEEVLQFLAGVASLKHRTILTPAHLRGDCADGLGDR
jgi:hypothetical protein